MKHSRTRFAFARAGLLCAIALLSVGVACEARMPTSAEVDAMTVESAERSAVKSKLLAEVTADRVYMLDGKVVSEAEAHAIAPGSIATINIVGRKMALDKEVVRISTLNNSKSIDEVVATKRAELEFAKTRSRVPADSGRWQLSQKAQLSKKQFDGVVLINGVASTTDALNALQRDQIESVEVIKGEAAMKMSHDPAAQFGIISIKMKNAKQ